MTVRMARVPPAELLGRSPPETSAVVARRVAAARALSLARNGGRPNAALNGTAIERACSLSPAARAQLADLASSSWMSARAVHRVLRVARTIADLGEREGVTEDELFAAVALHQRADTATRPVAA